jgi:hypothetical protein
MYFYQKYFTFALAQPLTSRNQQARPMKISITPSDFFTLLPTPDELAAVQSEQLPWIAPLQPLSHSNTGLHRHTANSKSWGRFPITHQRF